MCNAYGLGLRVKAGLAVTLTLESLLFLFSAAIRDSQ